MCRREIILNSAKDQILVAKSNGRREAKWFSSNVYAQGHSTLPRGYCDSLRTKEKQKT